MCCGVSLRLEDVADLDAARAAAEEHGIAVEDLRSLPAPTYHTW